MTGPVARGANPATVAEQQTEVFRLKLKGWTHDAIASELGISHGTVANRLADAIQERVGPVAESYADAREAELIELFAKAYAILTDSTDKDVQLKALDRCVKVNAERRKLRGADAPENMFITHDINMELSANAVTAAVLSVLDGLHLEGVRRSYALQLAQHALENTDNPQATAPPVPDDMPPEPYVDPHGRYVIVNGVTYERPQRDQPKALPPGRSAQGPAEGTSPDPGAPGPGASPQDGAAVVLSRLADFEREFGPLEGDDDE